MNRRTFIKNTALAGLAAGVVPPAAKWVLANGNKPFFRLSLAQWSLHRAILETKTLNSMDFAKNARTLGFEAVEYVSQLYFQEIKATGFENVMRELNKRSNYEGIKNNLIMVDDEGELAALSKTERNNAISNHSRWVDAAAELGCHAIRVNLFGKDAENDFTKWKQTSADGLGRLAEYAAKSNINVLVENHGGLSSDAEKLSEIIRMIGLNNCGTLPDFGNFCVKRKGGERWGAPCIDEYDKYKGVLEMMPFAHGVSAKSYDFDTNGNETTIDYYKMLTIVKEAGYTGYIGVEYEGNRFSEEAGIKATKDLLLKIASSM